MDDHAHRTVERHCDVAVVGASAGGLAAALELGRAHRSVIVVDAGEHSVDPAAREEVRSHGVEVLAARATGVTGTAGDHARVELTGGHAIVARRVLDATSWADAADGVHAAGLLAVGDVGTAVAASANETDWDRRYGDAAPIWSGNPNGTLVREAGDLVPGRALDVGAGEGGDALWLAERGWTVTANDISARALDRIGAEAARRGLHIELCHADANAADAFDAATFDLVSAQYAAIPRTPDSRGLRNLLDAVAPGGTLLVVSHDLEPMRAPVDTREHSRAFDADAYVRVEDVAAALGESSQWEVEVHEKRPRPPGSATAAHHVDDVVLRARRRAR